MNADAMISTLKSLKLFGMADTIGTMATQASPAYQQAVPILESLLKAEVAEREVRSINYQMKVAKFPAYRDLAGFDFTQSARSMRPWFAHCTAVSSWRMPRTSSLWVVRARARRTWPPPWPCKPSSITA